MDEGEKYFLRVSLIVFSELVKKLYVIFGLILRSGLS